MAEQHTEQQRGTKKETCGTYDDGEP